MIDAVYSDCKIRDVERKYTANKKDTVGKVVDIARPVRSVVASPSRKKMCGKVVGKTTIVNKLDNKTFDATIMEAQGEEGRVVFQVYIKQEKKPAGYMTLDWLRVREDGHYGSSSYANLDFSPKRFYGTELNGKEVIRNGENLSKIFIEIMESPFNEKYKGVGTALYQVAMEYGYKKGCEGRLQLSAVLNSHSFHYKLGMLAEHGASPINPNLDINQLIVDELEKAKIEERQPRTIQLGGIEMYMPEKNIQLWKEKIDQNPILDPDQ